MSGKTLFSLICLGLVNVYTTLNDAPVPVGATESVPLSSTTGLTKPNIASVRFALISLPLESVVKSPISFFFVPVPIVITGFT